MGTARPPKAARENGHASPHATTPEQQASIRLVFQSELGVANSHLIKVECAVLYNALSTKRHADLDAQDDGSLHSEVLKNTIDLLQRFHRCAPLYLKTATGLMPRNSNFFAKEVFCRTFCSDIEGFDNKGNPRAWIDVFHFFQAMKGIWDGSLLGGLQVSARHVVAAGFDARHEFSKAETRSRKGAVLWELMGMASRAIDRYGSTRPETWCAEAAVRVGMWRRLLKGDSQSLFRLPVEDDGWGSPPHDVLPEHDDNALKLFKELETKLRTFYTKCKEPMPEQATALPKTLRNRLSKAVNSATDREYDTGNHQGSEEMTQRDGASEELTPEMTPRYGAEQDIAPHSAIQQSTTPNTSIPQQTTAQVPTTGRASRQPRADLQRALAFRAREQADPRNIIITEDPRKFTMPRDPAPVTLERAQELITNVLHANGREPDWDPRWPRMVASASLREQTPTTVEGDVP